MLSNFARQHVLTRPSLWRILAWALGIAFNLIVWGYIAVGILWPLYEAMTIKIPAW